MLPPVAGVFHQGFAGPRFGTFEGIVVLGKLDEVHRQLPPSDQFADVRIPCCLGDFAILECFLDGQGDGDGADVAEVQIRREAAGSIHLGMISVLVVSSQILIDKIVKAFDRGMRSAGEALDGANGTIQCLPSVGNIFPHGK